MVLMEDTDTYLKVTAFKYVVEELEKKAEKIAEKYGCRFVRSWVQYRVQTGRRLTSL